MRQCIKMSDSRTGLLGLLTMCHCEAGPVEQVQGFTAIIRELHIVTGDND